MSIPFSTAYFDVYRGFYHGVFLGEGYYPKLNAWLAKGERDFSANISPIEELTLSAYVSTTMAASDAAPATPVANFIACVVSSPSNLVFSSNNRHIFSAVNDGLG